jgi:hypothetical protein
LTALGVNVMRTTNLVMFTALALLASIAAATRVAEAAARPNIIVMMLWGGTEAGIGIKTGDA